MKTIIFRPYLFVSAVSGLLAPTSSAFAYLGPGAGLGMIGSLIAIAVVVLVVVLGLVVYPIRMIRKRKLQAQSEYNEVAKPSQA